MITLKRWIARLSFSCLILGGLCGWTSYQTIKLDGWTSKSVLLMIAAILLAFMGMVGVRYRHNQHWDDQRLT